MLEIMQAFPAVEGSKSRRWCLVNLFPEEIKGAGRLAERSELLNCLGDWRLVAGSAGGSWMLPLLAGYLGLMVIVLSP